MDLDLVQRRQHALEEAGKKIKKNKSQAKLLLLLPHLIPTSYFSSHTCKSCPSIV